MPHFLARLVTAAAMFLSASTHGPIISDNQLSIDFTKPSDVESKATWSHPNKLAITPQGLGWDAGAA